jgi:flavorubredoxin
LVEKYDDWLPSGVQKGVAVIVDDMYSSRAGIIVLAKMQGRE